MTTITSEQELTGVEPKRVTLYSSFPLTSLTAYSLYWLHQWGLRRTIEAIAVLNWRLFPAKFAMVGFSQFPDAFRTNRSLLQGQPKYRNILTGAATKGFSLNDRGLRLATELIETLGVPETASGASLADRSALAPELRPQDAPRTLEPPRIIDRVKHSRLFQKWRASELLDRDVVHVHSLLDIYDHTPIRVRRQKMADLERAAIETGDDEVQRFLKDVKDVFPIVFEARSRK